MLEQEINYFDEHLSEWLKCESGKFTLIKGSENIGFFNTIDEALIEATQRFGLESYLVRRIIPEQEKVEIPAMTVGVFHANPTYPIQG